MPKYTNAMFQRDLAELESLISQIEHTGGSYRNDNVISGGKKEEGDRFFTVIEVDGRSKRMGRYRISSKGNPEEAAHKAFKQICRKDYPKTNEKTCNRVFKIQETTQGSPKRIYGPYKGEMRPLPKPIVKKAGSKTITIKHKYRVVKDNQKGGIWRKY